MRCYFLILGAFYEVEQSRSSISPILPPAGVFYPQNHVMESDVSCVACTKIQRLNLLFSCRRPLCNSYYIKSQVCFEQSPHEITFKTKVLFHNPTNFTERAVCLEYRVVPKEFVNILLLGVSSSRKWGPFVFHLRVTYLHA